LVRPAGVPEIEVKPPQAPGVAGSAVNRKVRSSPATAAPLSPFVTVTVTPEVLVTVAGTFFGDATTTTVLATGVWVIVFAFELPPFASVAVIAQVPAVVEAVYVVVSLPLVSVVPRLELSVPQEPAVPATIVNITWSTALAGPVTWTVTTSVVLPSAGTLAAASVSTVELPGAAGDF
jgi:hypothetical protein